MSDLRRHIPPIAVTWDDEVPGRSWRSIDGTLVFADISGFTALTERLSARGRIGAEQIIDTLNSIFGAMLVTASQRGGELLKFGGDALFFLFRGEGHPQRAGDAALDMRAVLRGMSHPPDLGRIRLSMSVGVHSGEVLLLNVGAPTRELLVLGPAATAVTAAEKAAEAGQIVLTEDAAARLPRRAVRRGDGSALLVRRTAPAPGGATAVPAVDRVDRARLRTLFPHELGEYLDAAAPDPEHRNACIGFVRFAGTDRLLADSGPQAVADAVGAVVTALQAATAREGVTLLATDVDADGGKFFLAAGVPRASEDDEGRMLRAMRHLLDCALPLRLSVGVNRGHVFAAEVGVGFRAAYSAMGDTTNTAARIMGKAPAGTLYAAPAVLEQARTSFAVEPAGPFDMKGKSAPVLVYAVGAEKGPREVRAAADLPMLGRVDELASLRTMLADAADGRGGVVAVSGPTGIGKSRLVAEALDGVGIPVIALRGEPYGASSAYRVFRDPLRAVLGLAPDAPGTMGEQLLASLADAAPALLPLAPLVADVVAVEVAATPESQAIDPQFRPERLASVVVELLAALRPGPLAILLEEGHWADAASALLLARIAAEAAVRPWLLMVARRRDGQGYDPAVGRRIDLPPLPDPVITELVVAASEATPLRPHEVEAIVDRASGSPLFVVEVMRTAVAGGSAAELPDSVQAVLAAQIDQLHPSTRRVLRYCSVLGRSFRRSVLRATLAADGIDVDAATIDDLAGFLEQDGRARLRFRNSLVRDAAYEGLAFRTRSRLHGVAGDVVERLSTDLDADAATLSLHFSSSGDHRRTWLYAKRAGEAARRRYANADAALQYERAIDAARRITGVPDDESVGLWLALGEVRELAGIFDGSIAAYARAAALAEDPARRVRMLIRKARVQERAGAYRAALQAVSRARRLLGDGPDAARAAARLDTLMALIRLGQEKPSQAREWAARAVDAARAAGDPETLVQALMAVDYADALLGRPVAGAATREALALCIEHGFRPRESVARANLGGYAFYAGRWTEAMQWFASSREAAVAAGNAFGAAETDLSIAEILINQRRTQEAEPLLIASVRVLAASGMEFSRAYAEMLLANAYRANGDLERAAELASRVAAEFTAMGHHRSALEASLVPARVATELGNAPRALEILDAAEAAAKGEGEGLLPRTSLERARALRALHRTGEAAAEVEAGLAAARRMELAYEEALLLLARADLAGAAAASDDASRARRILADLGARVA